MDVTNNSSGGAPAPCISIRTRRWLFVVIPQVVGDLAPPHNHSLASAFSFKVYRDYYYLMSSVGVSAPPPQSSFAPQGKSSPIFASRWTFILSSILSLELTPLSCKKHSPLLLFFCIPFWSFWRPLHSRRTDDLCYPDPPHRSFLTVHTLFPVHFFS